MPVSHPPSAGRTLPGACALLLLLSSCAQGPSWEPGASTAPRGAAEAKARSRPARAAGLQDSNTESPLPELRFGAGQALALEQARQLALSRNRGLAAAAAAVEAARARIASARAAFLPTLSLGASRTFNRRVAELEVGGGQTIRFGADSETRGNVQLAISLFAFGRDTARLEAARAAVLTESLAERSVQLELIRETTVAWHRVHEAREAIRVAESALQAAERQRQDAANLVEAGRVTRDAELTAKVEALSRSQELLAARNAHRQAQRVLNILLVRPAEAPLALQPQAAFRAQALDAEELLALARQHNPQLLSFRTRRAELRAEREAVSREIAPEIVGTAGLDYSEPDFGRGFPTQGTATLSVQWRPYEGGRRMARRSELRAQIAGLSAQEHEAHDRLELALGGLLLDLETSREAVAVATQSIAASTENERIVSDRFRTGRATAREVLEAQTTLVDARFQATQARFAYRALAAEIEALVGAGPGALSGEAAWESDPLQEESDR